MKKQLSYTIVGALLLAVTPAIADDEREGGKTVAHSVSGSHVDGATLWDYHGNKLGTIEKVLLIPKKSAALVVVDTSILDDYRKIVVPWSSLQVQTKEGDADDIIYALDADKAKLMASPMYTGEKSVLHSEVKSAWNYWTDKSERIGNKAKKGYEKARDAVKDAAEEAGDAIENATDELQSE